MQHNLVIGAIPLVHFHHAGCLHLLPVMYGGVYTTPSVLAELEARRGANMVAPAPGDLGFLTVQAAEAPVSIDRSKGIRGSDLDLFSLCRTIPSPLLLVEPRHLRRIADTLAIPTTGTIGVLLTARRRGNLDSLARRIPLLTEAGLVLSRKGILAALLLAGERAN